jgi:hypothetical protein
MRKTVSLPRDHYNAIKRVLKMTRTFIAANVESDTLHACGYGLITGAEIDQHICAAIKLMPTKRRASARRSSEHQEK